MTLQEFSLEFDTLYNNIGAGAAPGINSYEKSLFLTNAQEAIVKTYYSGDLQKLIPSFEEDERKRRELGELVRPYKVEYNANLNLALQDRRIHPKSVFFAIPDDVLFIIQEQAITYPDPCDLEGKSVKISPIRHDYFNKQIDNPFRKPNKKNAWRLDLESYVGQKIIEIVHLWLPIRHYSMRYVHAPQPIVLETFENNPELSGLNLSIRGMSTESNTELDSLGKEIVDLAVRSAIMRYRENSLENIKNF